MVDDSDPGCAQVVATAGDPDGTGLLLYSHLDTSLTGDLAFDAPITGRPPAALGVRVDDVAGTISGFGLGVAKGPAAAAMVAFGRAHERLESIGAPYSLRLLLAARGTHRAPDWPVDGGGGSAATTGVERWLADGIRPAAAIVAKGGPVGVLHDEPGACYVRVRLTTGWGAAMNRRAVDPPGGVLAHLGVAVAAIESAGDDLADTALRSQPAGGQAGACFGLGAIRSGQPTKSDLIPGAADVFGYLVLPGALDANRLAAGLETRIRERVAGSALDGCQIAVDVSAIHDGAATEPTNPVVVVAREEWSAAYGRECPTIAGWTGSTDGVALRAAGIPTARFGPSRTVGADGVDRVDLAELVALTRAYERVAVRSGSA